MKTTPELKKAQENMLPGAITADGFMGTDTRPLSTVIDEDEQVLRKLGLDPAEVAERLRGLMEKGRAGLGEPITVDGQWLVQTDEARGKLPCPWEDGVHRKVNVTVTRTDTGEKLFFTALSIHLLEVHHFLEGRGSAFRLNLEAVKHVLKM